LAAGLAFGHAESTGTLAFDLPTLLATPLPVATQYVVFLLLLVGFAAKVPLVPLHTWLPSLAMGAPAAVTALIVGLKLGAYGLIRLAIPLAPIAARDLHWLLAGSAPGHPLRRRGGDGAQQSARHAGLYEPVARRPGAARSGELLGVGAAGRAAAAAQLQRRRRWRLSGARLPAAPHRLDRHRAAGRRDAQHALALGFFLLFGLAGIGLPGTSGFPGELLIIVAALHSHTGAGLAALFGTVLAAAGLPGAFPARLPRAAAQRRIAAGEDLLPREKAVLLLPALLILAVGVYPNADTGTAAADGRGLGGGAGGFVGDGSLAQVGNNGPVFFVAGSIFGVPTDRTFTVPAGRPIFFPVINNLWIETPPIVCFPDFPCALDQITPFITDATDLHATLDGQNLLIPDALGFRQTSSEFFLIALPDDNLFGAPEDAYPAVSDGYWVAVEGLSPGPHTLIFGATSGDFLVEVTANLTVPEPGTLGLVLLGALVATGRFRSGTAVTPRQPA
jgi:hypothetical protein